MLLCIIIVILLSFVGEIKEKVYCSFLTRAGVLYGKYSTVGWQIQYSGLANTARWAVQNCQDYHRPCKQHISKQTNVVLDVSRYFSSLLAALFYSTHLLGP